MLAANKKLTYDKLREKVFRARLSNSKLLSQYEFYSIDELVKINPTAFSQYSYEKLEKMLAVEMAMKLTGKQRI